MKHIGFMRSHISRNFEKIRIFKKILRIFCFFIFLEKKDKTIKEWRGTLRVLRAETWLTVYRTIAISPTRRVIRKPWHRPTVLDSLLVWIVVELRPGGSARPHEAIRSYSTSPPSGNQVDGSPLDWHTETLAKPGRLGPAQNDKPMRNFIELAVFCIISEVKNSRISCPEYIVALDKCMKTYKRRCHGQIYDISGPGKISKKWEFSRKSRKI